MGGTTHIWNNHAQLRAYMGKWAGGNGAGHMATGGTVDNGTYMDNGAGHMGKFNGAYMEKIGQRDVKKPWPPHPLTLSPLHIWHFLIQLRWHGFPVYSSPHSTTH